VRGCVGSSPSHQEAITAQTFGRSLLLLQAQQCRLRSRRHQCSRSAVGQRLQEVPGLGRADPFESPGKTTPPFD
jgi:hypothetical protein